MAGLLSPAGDRIFLSFSRPPCQRLSEAVARDGTLLFKSGAMALSAAVEAAMRRKQVGEPEVIIPAYTCPSVAAAIIHAGARPVLADLDPGSLFLDISAVEEALSGNTVAIVSVNLFGVEQPAAELRQLADRQGATLIEDDAQGFPVLRPDSDKAAEITVLSFSRGKQVSILGGGAAVINQVAIRDKVPAGTPPSGILPVIWLRLMGRTLAYNLLRWPPAFGLLEGLEFLGIGQTVYAEMDEVLAMDAPSRCLLANNLARRAASAREAQTAIAGMLRSVDSERIKDLVPDTPASRIRPLSRYPLLADSAQLRELLIAEFRAAGIGASRMYGRALPAVARVPAVVGEQGPFQNAETLASRLITLPVHDGVRSRHLSTMRRILMGQSPDTRT